jgi:hypothetical protein
MRTSLWLAVASLVLPVLASEGGCTPHAPSSPPVVTAATTAARAPATASDAQPKAAPASSIVEGPPPPAPRCRLTVTDTEGCQPDQIADLVSPVRSQIERCRGASGGKLLVRVRKVPGGRLAFDVAPGTSLDPTEKRCVLDALNSLPQSESSTAWTGGPAVPPTGFSSLLTIEW